MADHQIRKAVYAGSFDPVTNGHVYMMETGAQLYDELIVAVAANPDKKYMFTAEERVKLLRAASESLGNVRVELMPDVFVVDFARSLGAGWLLRGVRNDEDFGFETTMRNVNADIGSDITTVFLMPPRELVEISSSFVKGLVGPDGWERVVEKYLPSQATRALVDRIQRKA